MSTLPSPSVANNFVDPNTAMSLPIATSVISITGQIANRLIPSLGDTVWLPVMLCIGFGIVLYSASESRGEKWQEKAPALFTAFANTVLLIAAVLGISGVAPGTA